MSTENGPLGATKEKKCSNANLLNICLVINVFLVAAISIGLYIYKFRGSPISTNTSDWADFATYLSGTVGVSAVVATLLAFIKTLGQQQKLIDSQDEMLVEQKRQIKLAERQNLEVEERHRVEIAYSNTREILPGLMTLFDAWINDLYFPYHNSNLRDALQLMVPRNFSSTEYLIDNPDLIEGFLEDVENVNEFLNVFFDPIRIVYEFACDQIRVAPVLKVYFDAKLWVNGPNNTKFKFHCYQAFLVGRNDDLYKKGVECLGLRSDYSKSNTILEIWQRTGNASVPKIKG